MSPSVIEIIQHCQKRIKKDPPEDKLLRYIERLRKLDIEINDLQETGIGRTINQLSRLDGPVGQSAWELVSKWKAIVEAQEKSDSSGGESESEASSNEEEDRLVIDDAGQNPIDGVRGNNLSSEDHDEEPSFESPPKQLQIKNELLSSEDEELRKSPSPAPVPVVAPERHYPNPITTSNSKLIKKEALSDDEKKKPSSSVPNRHHNHHHHHKRSSSSKPEIHDSNSQERTKRKIDSSSSNHSTPDKKSNESKKLKVEHTSSSSFSPKKDKSASNSNNPEPSVSTKPMPKVLQRLDSSISEIDSTSGLNFADVLGCLDSSKSKHKSKSNGASSSKKHKEKDSHSQSKHHSPDKNHKVNGSSSSRGVGKEKSKFGESSSASSSRHQQAVRESKPSNSKSYEPENNITKAIVESLADDNDWANEMNNMWFGNGDEIDNGQDALSTMMANRNQRTKVYSGNKTIGGGKVPTLFSSCLKVIQDNIDQLGHTGGVPFEILEPVLNRTTVPQLIHIENYNPYLVEDTDKLWKFHCSRDFRGKVPAEFESWRELYLRCVDERDKRFASLTNKLKCKLEVATPVRKTKLAYVDTQSGPKYNKSKAAAIKTGMTSLKTREEKGRQVGGHGSSASAGGNNNQQNIKLEQASVIIAGKKARGGGGGGGGHVSVARETTSSASASAANKKPRKAPLMQKTLKSLKSLMRR